MLTGELVLGEKQRVPQNRVKRYWSETRPFELDYPNFDDDKAEEEHYREELKNIEIPMIKNLVIRFTYVPRRSPTTTLPPEPEDTEAPDKETTDAKNATGTTTTTKAGTGEADKKA
ncbi:unnamed protein product [Gongylonema pulchrum]|uniref:Uncharacterized protein n=1 Tax=Gongylonema pulchrum TaxID=637853 RepID=A0A3P6R1A9_9BILA|nr:unnamed protein product [Gongylonema pulchrum]